MARFAIFLLASALIAVSTAFGNDLPQISSPLTHFVLHDHLYTTIHTSVQRFKSTYFSGKIVGKFEKAAGGGWYKGAFRGTTTGKKTKATFGYKIGGTCKSMGFNVRFGGAVAGKMSVHGKKVVVHAGYATKGRGTVHGVGLKGSAKGKVYFTSSYGSFYYYEHGHTVMYIGGKTVKAKYYVTLTKKAVKVAVYGVYGGKKFFAKYSFSLNLLPLGIDMNPYMIKRNYGTVYVYVNGKKYTKKFDVRNTAMPKLM